MRQKSPFPAHAAPLDQEAPTLGPGATPLQDAGGGGNAYVAALLGGLAGPDLDLPTRSSLPVQDAGDQKLWELLGLPIHRRYKPLGDIERLEYDDGTEQRRYTTSTGAAFEAWLDADDYTTSISGTGLHLKDQLGIDGRGYTGDAVGKEPGAGQHSSHLIADLFTGSGYKEAGNLIATSATYNWYEMSMAEDLIREAVEAHGAESFDMDVAVDWGAMDDPGVIQARVDDAVLAALAEDPDLSEDEIAALRAEEEARLREALADYQEEFGSDMKRCLGVRYDVTLHLPDGTELPLDPIALGADKHMGFEGAEELDLLEEAEVLPWGADDCEVEIGGP